MHAEAKAKAEPVLVAWGIDTNSKPVFLGLAPGAAESAGAWRCLLDHLAGRGPRSPLLVISDGGSGLCPAIECAYPGSLQVGAVTMLRSQGTRVVHHDVESPGAEVSKKTKQVGTALAAGYLQIIRPGR